MNDLKNRLVSIRETIGADYTRPSKEKMDEFVANLFRLDYQVALNYLKNERGLTDETIIHFRLGYDPSRDAIAIPVYRRGELINIKYRFINPKSSKYSSERNAENWIFNEDGINEGLKKKGILIVEGEFDCMSVWQSGIKNVISPSSGKDSYAPWIEILDNIPRVFIALDNDPPGRETAIKMSNRIGIEKCQEVRYPENIKDANEFFRSHTNKDFKDLIYAASPFYKYQFKNVGDVIKAIREGKDDQVKLDLLPKVNLERDWLVVVSGKSNVGKTSYVMNLADDLTKKKIPTLIFPFERGIETVGKRFLQVKFDKTMQDFQFMDDQEWGTVVGECLDLPAYFSLPKKDELIDTIKKAKRIFDIRVVIIDHLDYIVRHTNGNKENEISNTLQDLKRIAEEFGIIMLIVTHVRKVEGAGSQVKRKAGMEDLKGSSSLYQDPEVVVMLSEAENGLEVNIVKNKGEMKNSTFKFNATSGKVYKEEVLPVF